MDARDFVREMLGGPRRLNELANDLERASTASRKPEKPKEHVELLPIDLADSLETENA